MTCTGEEKSMCKLCEAGLPQNHFGSRRNFLKGLAATGLATGGLKLFAPRPAAAQNSQGQNSNSQGQQGAPLNSGTPGVRYVIRGGAVMTMDGGEFPVADVLVEGKKILAVGPNLGASGQAIDASGAIVMP